MNDARLRDLTDRVVLAVGGPRRVLAALLAAVAVVALVQALAPAAPRTVAVWVAAPGPSRGRPPPPRGGRALAPPAGAAPPGARRAVVGLIGRRLAAPVRRGEPLADVRLLGQSLLSALPEPGLVAVPVRVADGSAAAALVQPGDVVDVLAATDPTGGDASAPATVASGVRVLAGPARGGPAGNGRRPR